MRHEHIDIQAKRFSMGCCVARSETPPDLNSLGLEERLYMPLGLTRRVADDLVKCNRMVGPDSQALVVPQAEPYMNTPHGESPRRKTRV